MGNKNLGGYECQTQVRHSEGLKYLIRAAKDHVPVPGGMGISMARFFELGAGVLATKILKELGIYQQMKDHWEATNGSPLDVFDIPESEGGEREPVTAEDPQLKSPEED